MTLKELKIKYPLDESRMSCAPWKKCPLCKGAGEYEGGAGKPVWCGCLTMKGWTEERKHAVLAPRVAAQEAALAAFRKRNKAKDAEPEPGEAPEGRTFLYSERGKKTRKPR